MKIYKYPLELVDQQTVHLPYGYRILTAQLQNGNLQLWALIDPIENLSIPVSIGIYGTGNPINEDPGKYISTVQLYDGGLVFHVFERTESGRL